MPEAQVIQASYSFNLAMDLSRRCRDIIRSEKYQTCFPFIRLRDDQNVKTHYMNTTGGFRVSVGTGGITGFHGHIIIVDDPLDPNESLSEAKLDAANTWMSETLSQRKIDKTETPTILIMQRLHQNDPTNTMMEQAKELQRIEGGRLKVKHLCLPAEITERLNPPALKKYYKKGLMDPVRLPVSVLNDNKARGDFVYSGQYLQWPVPRGGGMFKTDRIKIDTPVSTKFVEKVRYWDKAGTEAGTGAYTVGALLGKDREGRFWILDIQRGRWESSEREKVIKATAKIDGFDIRIGLEQEPGSGGKESAQSTVRNLAGYKVVVDRPTGSKEDRADPYSVQVNNGNVYMVQADWNREYVNELQFFPLSQYKDQVDASSGAFNILARGIRIVGAFRNRNKN